MRLRFFFCRLLPQLIMQRIFFCPYIDCRTSSSSIEADTWNRRNEPTAICAKLHVLPIRTKWLLTVVACKCRQIMQQIRNRIAVEREQNLFHSACWICCSFERKELFFVKCTKNGSHYFASLRRVARLVNALPIIIKEIEVRKRISFSVLTHKHTICGFRETGFPVIAVLFSVRRFFSSPSSHSIPIWFFFYYFMYGMHIIIVINSAWHGLFLLDAIIWFRTSCRESDNVAVAASQVFAIPTGWSNTCVRFSNAIRNRIRKINK